MEIAEFIAARLDEDEAAAGDATPGPWAVENDENAYLIEQAADDHLIAETLVCSSHPERGEPDAVHIARHDPARVLREVEAKRAILAEHGTGSDPCDAHNSSMETIPCDTLLYLAAVWSDHPDYREDWRHEDRR